MGRPVRVQRKRTRGWVMPTNTVVVSRPSEWGNPFRVVRAGLFTGHEDANFKRWWVESGSGVWMFATRQEAAAGAVKLYRAWLEMPQRSKLRARAELGLRGKNLACWCKIGDPCHADVLLELANRPAGTKEGS